MDNIQLYIFDWDGTLAKFKTGEPLPNVKEKLATLPDVPKVIATNQGGVGFRWWQEHDGFGEPERLPTEAHIRRLFKSTMAELGIMGWPVYFSFAYQAAKSGRWSPEPPHDTLDRECWRHDWRKPQAGMLLAAMERFGVAPEHTLMIGDWDEDTLAASLAGVHFQFAKDFFGWEESAAE